MVLFACLSVVLHEKKTETISMKRCTRTFLNSNFPHKTFRDSFTKIVKPFVVYFGSMFMEYVLAGYGMLAVVNFTFSSLDVTI